MPRGRVIHALSSLQIGGAERLVVDLAALQRRRGLDVVILNFGSASDLLCEEALKHGVDLRCLGDVSTSWGKSYLLWNTLRESSRAALHIHSPWCLPRLAPLLPLFRGAVVYTRHGAHAYDSPFWKALHLWSHAFIDHLTFVSPQSRDVHSATYGPKGPLHVIEFGVDIPPMVERDGPADGLPVRLGCVGRLVAVKGQRIVIEALSLLDPHVPWQMHFYGDGPDRSALEAVAASFPHLSIQFHGSVLDRQAIYADMDLLIVASRMEGRSLAIMEAMARGIPVIATRVGGNPTMIGESSAGILVPYGDAKALAGAIGELLRDTQRRQALGRGARHVAQASFPLERAAALLEPMYRLN